jgi:hypothetical protein
MIGTWESRVVDWKRWLYFILLAALGGSLLVTAYAAVTGTWPTSKLMSTTSALAALTAIAQLSVSEFWAKVTARYGDAEAFPFGPPSYVSRRIIYNPDTPIRSAVRQAMIFDTRTAVWLGVLSTLLGGVSVWL